MSHHETKPGMPEHRGDYAEGQEKAHTDADALMGDFAEGQEKDPEAHEQGHRGDFAEGQQEGHVDPAKLRGDYARGQEDTERR